jgi:hypothetical protein
MGQSNPLLLFILLIKTKAVHQTEQPYSIPPVGKYYWIEQFLV